MDIIVARRDASEWTCVCVAHLHLDCEGTEDDLRLIDHELGFDGRELMSYGAKCLFDSPRFSSIGT